MNFSKCFTFSSSDEESSQVFIPFVSDVRVGSAEIGHASSLDLDDSINAARNSDQAETVISPSERGVSGSMHLTTGESANKDRLTPPSSPHVGKESRGSEFFSDPVDLQLDYWINEGNNNSESSNQESKSFSASSNSGSKRDSYHHKSKDDSKSSIKTSIRYMLIQKALSGGISLDEGAAGNLPAPTPSSATPSSSGASFTMQYWIKEKKPKSKTPNQ